RRVSCNRLPAQRPGGTARATSRKSPPRLRGPGHQPPPTQKAALRPVSRVRGRLNRTLGADFPCKDDIMASPPEEVGWTGRGASEILPVAFVLLRHTIPLRALSIVESEVSVRKWTVREEEG